ncbi:excinuclease ABC subunit UvrA [Cytophagaceae bacterium ABcell3]|nr:excinuclease ABC subunit UvrA [Cytophagaceae bacterium ABcell3]
MQNNISEKIVPEKADPKQFIIIKGAKVNNLKNITVAIPRNKLVVVTGLSGSGKSSLAFDTLFAEGQRMYVESLSSYARQFLGRMEKPEVEYIKGIAPAIAIEQKVNTRNPRSTVGTTTEIYDYLKLLFSRVGRTYSPVSGEEVKRNTVSDVIDFIHSFEEGEKVMILCPLNLKEDRELKEELALLLQKGFSRIYAGDTLHYIEETDASNLEKENIYILIDRNVVRKDDEETQFRLADSIQTAFFEGEGSCRVIIPGKADKDFSDKFELDGIVFEEPNVNFFSFNNPYGACRTCEGFGSVLGIDEDLVIPDKSLSVYEGAIAPWRSEKMSEWAAPLLKKGVLFDFPIHRAWQDLDPHHQKLIWTGNEYFQGLNDFFKHLESQTHKIQYRVLLSRYRGRTVCPDCRGTRLRKDALYVKIDNTSIADIVLKPISEVVPFFDNLKLTDYEHKVADRIITEISSRLEFLTKVGLEYLTLNRLTNTLSGGEFQRIKLATSLGSALVGSMYILDEPSIGLHPRDTGKMAEVLRSLKAMGNSVIVVEHEEEVMRIADEIIDIGPDAGSHGGELVFQGTLEEMLNSDTPSHTAKYLKGEEKIETPSFRRSWTNFIEIKGARENNLKNVDVKIPLNALTFITGVSGSGKSTLIKKILFPAMKKMLGQVSDANGKFDRLEGSISQVAQIEFVDQNPIGKSSRSNPVTYIKAYDVIRSLYAEQPLAKMRGYKPGFFSFNVDGGRCEICQGEGTVKVEMQFMADIFLKCEGCNGQRFKQEVLEVTYKDKNIYEVLEMTVDDSLEFFKEQPKLIEKLQPLSDVGLGYIRLGQSSNTLSGGEAQRVKLASFLSKGAASAEKILFIFDEPTTGLHFHDIKKLLGAINALVDQGNSAVIIEHNMEMIKCADWIIDLGPEGGDKGGHINFAGVPEDFVKLENNHTARYLREKL